MITQTLQLNLVPKGVWPRLYVSQYDAGSRTLTFEIYNGDQRFTLTSGTTAKIQGTKPDRHGFSYDADVDTSNNVITADITQQMTAAHGEAYCELVLFKSGQRIGTLNFVMMIQQAGLNDETDTSDSDLPDIIAEATEQMLTAEAYAKGTRNGTAVTSGQTGYHDNSKYYKEQAATQASNASTSATSANTNALKAEGYAVGKQNGTTQTSGTYYHNNAQYYKEQAASSATTASTKAGEASTSANTASQKASAASTSAQTASDKALVAEGYAKGTQNGTPVGSTSPYYHNNAEYFKDLANPTVAANVSFNNSGTEMSSTNVQDGIVENRTSIQNLSNQVKYNTENGVINVLSHNMVSSTTGNVAFSIDINGVVTATGQASTDVWKPYNNNVGMTLTRKMKLVGCPSTGSSSKWFICASTTDNTDYKDYGSGVEIPVGKTIDKVYIVVKSGQNPSGAEFKPMLVDADLFPNISYSDFVPFAMTNQQLTKETTGLIDNQNVNGVKNILPTPYYQTKGGTFTGNSLTVTENSDGSVKINGTASAQSYIDLARNSTFLKPGRYILSGGKTSKRNIYINATNNGSYVRVIANSSSEESTFTIDYNGYNAITVGLSIAAGETLSNVTFYPMIRSASIEDDTYEPYAKSNRELTEDVDSLLPYSTLLGNLTNGDVTSFLKVRDVAMNIYWTDNTGASDWSNMTNQQLTDVVQALLDTYKKLGGAKDIIYFGRLRIRGLTSNGTSISEGIYTPFALTARETYNTILSTQSGGGRNYGVITLIYFNVGGAAMCNLSMWSDDIRFSKLGLVDQSSPTTTGAQKLYSSKYTRITTYKG